MRNSLLLIICVLVVSCSSTPKDHDFRVLKDSITDAQSAVKKAVIPAKVIQKQGTKPNSPESNDVVKFLEEAGLKLEVSQKQVDIASSKFELNNSLAKKYLAQKQVLDVKLAKVNGAIWKRNFIIAGQFGIILGLLFWIFKSPIMSAVGFITRKAGGIPW